MTRRSPSIRTRKKAEQEAAVFLNKLMRGGSAVFLERGKKTYRVKGYDPKKDLLTVAIDEKGKTVTTRGRKAKTTAVAPVAGGL